MTDDKHKQAAQEYETRWNAMVPSYEEHWRLRDRLYGIRIEDDPHPEHAGSFTVVCPEHGHIGDDLQIAPARKLRDDHDLSHHPLPADAP